jgi:hypothetical protein
MKSLLLKDIYFMKSGLIIYAILLAFASCGVIIVEHPVFILIFSCMFSVFVASIAFGAEVPSTYREYESTMPFSIYEIVGVKYIEIAVFFLINGIVSLFAYTSLAQSGFHSESLLTNSFGQIAIFPSWILIVMSLLIPLGFRFPEFAMGFGFIAALGVVFALGEIAELIKSYQSFFAIGFPVAAVAAFIGGFAASVAILRRTET